jgi:predicted transcriptional regulator
MEIAMLATPKIETQNMLNSLPDNSTFEDIQYHLYVTEKIRKGQAQLRNGECFTHEEAKKRLEKWLIK